MEVNNHMYYMLGLSVITASLNSIVMRKVKLNNIRDTFLFNLIVSFIWFGILISINGFSVAFNHNTILWGTVYGITQALFVFFKTLSMNSGSVSVTTLIGNSSLFISVFVSFLVWDERVSVLDGLGLIILVISIFLCTYRKSGEEYNKKWGVYTFFFLVFASGVGIVFKAFGKSGNLDLCSDMMVVSSVVMIISYTLMCSFVNFRCDYKVSQLSKGFIAFAVFAGVLSCVYNRLNIYLSGVLDAVVFFPSFNGGVIFLSSILSIAITKEKLSSKQIFGILLGIMSICIIGIF